MAGGGAADGEGCIPKPAWGPAPVAVGVGWMPITSIIAGVGVAVAVG